MTATRLAGNGSVRSDRRALREYEQADAPERERSLPKKDRHASSAEFDNKMPTRVPNDHGQDVSARYSSRRTDPRTLGAKGEARRDVAQQMGDVYLEQRSRSEAGRHL